MKPRHICTCPPAWGGLCPPRCAAHNPRPNRGKSLKDRIKTGTVIRLSAALLLFALAPIARAQDPTPTPAPSPTPVLDGFSVAAKLGGSVSMSSNANTLLTPIAKVGVSGPLAIGAIKPESLPVLHVDGELSALPGDTIDQASGLSGTLAQFKALDFSVGLSKGISKWTPMNNGRFFVRTSVYLEAGFATRLDNEQKARDKAPRYGCLGLRFDEARTSSYLKTGFCADQRLDGSYQATATVTGIVTAFDFGPSAGVSLYVKAILGLDFSSPTRPALTGANRDSVNVGTLMGWN